MLKINLCVANNKNMSKYRLKIFRVDKKLLGNVSRCKAEKQENFRVLVTRNLLVGIYVCTSLVALRVNRSGESRCALFVLLEQRLSGGS
jgi:hypothetical protein